MLPVIGIIAGRGGLPLSIATEYVNKGGKCCIALLEGEADARLIENFQHKSFKIGMVGAVIDYFHENNVENIIFAGGINRPNLRSIKVDAMGASLIGRIMKEKFLGDDKVLRIVAKFFEEKGFKVISGQEILDQKFNTLTEAKPSKSDISDIELGIKLLDNLSEMDVGQSVIIEDGYILGIEAAEGTDNLIERCSMLRKKPEGGVLVKMMKTTQDSRFDMPTIGPDTIIKLAHYGYKGIAIQKNMTIIIKPEVTMKLANEHNIFILSK